MKTAYKFVSSFPVPVCALLSCVRPQHLPQHQPSRLVAFAPPQSDPPRILRLPEKQKIHPCVLYTIQYKGGEGGEQLLYLLETPTYKPTCPPSCHPSVFSTNSTTCEGVGLRGATPPSDPLHRSTTPFRTYI